MKRLIAVVLVSLFGAASASAMLKNEAKAPDFTVEAALGGKTFSFHLADALKKGPVVLYFYPKSFTQTCTIEAHDFADNAANFAAAGASLVGVSADTIDTQIQFSSKGCRDKFPVGADPDGKVIHAYDAQWMKPGANPALASRISYVIAPDGRIIYAYQDMSPEKHIANTLAVVRQWRKDHRS
jgi:peroxiredoxin